MIDVEKRLDWLHTGRLARSQGVLQAEAKPHQPTAWARRRTIVSITSARLRLRQYIPFARAKTADKRIRREYATQVHMERRGTR